MIIEEFDEGHEIPLKQAQREANKQLQSGRFEILDMQWDGKPQFKLNDVLVTITEERGSQLVAAPARVLSIVKWQRQDKYIVCIEQPLKRRKKLEKLPIEGKELFKRKGRKGAKLSSRIIALWR